LPIPVLVAIGITLALGTIASRVAFTRARTRALRNAYERRSGMDRRRVERGLYERRRR